MKKLTNVATLEAMINLVVNASTNVMDEFTNDEVIEKLTAMQNAFTKKNSGNRKPSSAQAENDRIRSQLMEAMADGVLRTTSDIRDSLSLPVETTPQRIAGLVRPLVDEGKLVKHTIKRKVYYSIPGVDIPTE